MNSSEFCSATGATARYLFKISSATRWRSSTLDVDKFGSSGPEISMIFPTEQLSVRREVVIVFLDEGIGFGIEVAEDVPRPEGPEKSPIVLEWAMFWRKEMAKNHGSQKRQIRRFLHNVKICRF